MHRWVKIADREDGHGQTSSPADTDDMAAQLREEHKRINLLEQEAEVMRREVGYCPGTPTRMMYPLVLDLADDGVPVAVTCRVLDSPPRRSTNDAKNPAHSGIGATRTSSTQPATSTPMPPPSATDSSSTNFLGRDHCRREPCRAAVPAGVGLVDLRQEAWTEPPIRPTRP